MQGVLHVIPDGLDVLQASVMQCEHSPNHQLDERTHDGDNDQ